MAMNKDTQPSFSFVKGIITEASPLTYPENATIDEENFALSTKGTRSRRLGVDYETSYTKEDSQFPITYSLDDVIVDTYRWDNVDNDPTISLLVTRVASELRFFDLYTDTQSGTELYSDVSSIPEELPIEFSSVNGYLIVSASDLSSGSLLRIYYDGGGIYSEELPIEVRDIWGLDDGLAIDERPETLSDNHEYNLYNQGWDDERINLFSKKLYDDWRSGYYSAGDYVVPITPNDYYYKATVAGTSGASEPTWPTTIGASVSDGSVTWVNQGTTTSGVYPSNADMISLGEKTDGDWDSDLIKDYLLGTTPAPKGKRIINLITGTSVDFTIPPGTAAKPAPGTYPYGGFTCSTSYAGRLFLSGYTLTSGIINTDIVTLGSIVIFSQLVDKPSKLSKFYQDADPTAEDINELVDTDGGIIPIPEASGIHKLVSVGKSLLIFAENGVWELTGGDSGFRATDFQIRKVSNIGSVSASAIVNAEGTVFYFSKNGIYVVTVDQVSGMYNSKSLSKNTIQSLYLSIPNQSKARAKGIYVPDDQLVRWVYQTDETEDKYIYNAEIIFDIQLTAFYKYSYRSIDDNSPRIASLYTTPNFTVASTTEVVVDESFITVTDEAGDDVTIPYRRRTSGLSKLKYFLIEKPATGTYWKYSFGIQNNVDFVDWKSYDGTGVDAPAYMVTGYNISGDSMRYKQVPYITFHFNRTETGFSGTLDPADPSSCLVTPYWDWSDSQTSGKIGTQFQAYRLSRNYIPTDSSDTFDYGQVVVSTKNKLRGRGRSLSLRIDTEAGKDCQLLGWSLFITGNTVV